MQNASYISNPTVRVQHSSPTPQPPSDQLMLAQRPFLGGSGWPSSEGFPGAAYLSPVQKNLNSARFHKRASSGSGSSIASVGPPSPLSQTTTFPHIATSDFAPYEGAFEYMQTPPSARTAKPLPTPTTEAFMYQPGNYHAVDMRRIHSSGADDNASYVSSMGHNSPATPHTTYETEFDDSKMIYSSERKAEEQWMEQYLLSNPGFQPTAAYQQSLQDVFPESPFAQNPMAYPQQMTQRMNAPIVPNMMMNRIQAAQRDHLRTSSPVTSNPRDKSPFRQNSPYAESMRAPVQRPQQNIPQLQKTRTSISPKELMLDEHDVDDAGPPLFHDQNQSMFASGRQSSNLPNYYAPSFSQEQAMQIPQQYPFVSQRSRQESSQSVQPEQTPEFPAHLASMESTAEEGPSEPSSQQSGSRPALHSKSQSVQRPMDTSSDAGTYTCTYHGCTLRFETPAKLQKHKREGHRQASPLSHSQNIALRNSQAGPHKCERVNPSTGKPCNSIFSRPYDLTRHEDTIHNGRKQKVRCHLCTEEKTFSRNDALTRHMRVVHPDVEFSGRARKHSGRV